MRRISRNLTAGTIGECRCEYCHITTMRMLKNIVPVVLTCGVWLAVKTYREKKANERNQSR
jgi:hypothetical protein